MQTAWVYFVFLKFIFIAFSLFSFRMNFKYFCFSFIFVFAILFAIRIHYYIFCTFFKWFLIFIFAFFCCFCFVLFAFVLFCFALFVYNLSQPYKLKIDINQYIVLFNEICRLFIAISVVLMSVCLSVSVCVKINECENADKEINLLSKYHFWGGAVWVWVSVCMIAAGVR